MGTVRDGKRTNFEGGDRMKIGQDDGYGNKVGKLQLDITTKRLTLECIHKGDIIQITNKEGLVIATYKVV